MKAFKWILFAVFITALGFLAWHFLSPYSKTDPLDAIPYDAVMIAETDNLFDAWDKLTTNKAWEKLKHQPVFEKLGKGVGMMDTIIQSNRQLSEFIGHRKVYVSMHMTGSSKYDFAYVIDLRRISKILKLKDLVGSFTTSSLVVTKIKSENENIFQVEMKKNGQKFFCYFNNNLFVGSFSKSIVEKSAKKTSTDNSFNKDVHFTEIKSKTSGNGIFGLYINYSGLDDYLKSMLVKLDDNTRNLVKSLRYSGLTFDIESEGSIVCQGYTIINDSVTSSLKAVINSGMGNSSIEEVLPSKFSSSVSLCFNKFTDYFDNMQESLKETPYAYNNYQQEIETIEKFLGISVRENFMDWIGEEVTLVQMEPMGLGKNNEFAVFLKARNMNNARENLAFVAKRIKNRTPVKIEDIDYKGYPIHYMSVKGFFKVLLGKYFQKLESPYYSFVGDYVVLSNHPQVIKTIIDAQTNEMYIEKDKIFSDFYSSFGRRSNALVLVNTNSFLKALRYDLRPQSFRQLDENSHNLRSFPFLGFQLSKDGDYFKTRVYAYYAEEIVTPEMESAPVDTLAVTDSVKLVVDTWIKEADSYVPVDLKQEIFTDNYADGRLKVQFEMKDGFRNGDYRDYHPNGKLRSRGGYKNDKKHGTWHFYTDEGKQIRKQDYKNGELQD